MTSMKFSALFCSFFVSSLTAAGEISVFSLPLGSKPSNTIPKCPKDRWKSTAICWVNGPNLQSNKSLAGDIFTPDNVTPVWATEARKTLWLDPSGKVSNLVLKWGPNTANRHEAATSITLKFGTPIEDKINGEDFYAAWSATGNRATLSCTLNTMCYVQFQSAETYSRRLADLEKSQNSRPAAP